MKNRILSAAILFIFGLLIALGPQTIFHVCEVMDGRYMTCHWMGLAELGAGAVIAVLGILLLVFKSVHIRIGLTISAVLNSILALLIPAALIGVCDMAAMTCRVITYPALLVISILAILVSGANLLYLIRQSNRQAVPDEKKAL